MITSFTVTHTLDKTEWDVSTVVNNIKLSLDLDFSAGTLTFDLIDGLGGFSPQSGDIVQLSWDEVKTFYGRIFKVSYNQDKKYSITAYDNSRYLKNQDSIVWPVSTISQRFTQMAKTAEVPYKVVNDSTYKVPAEVCDGKSYFDMLKSAIDATEKATDQMYYIGCAYDTLELRKAPYNELELVIGDKQFLTAYSFDRSIDDAANVVRIVKKNQEESQNTSATASEDTSQSGDDPDATSFSYSDATGNTINQWGKLQVVETAKDKANDAQMAERAKELLNEKNRETYTLKLTAIGNLDLIPGNSVAIKIEDLTNAGFEIKRAAILKATHNFNSDYTTEIEMKVNPKWLESTS